MSLTRVTGIIKKIEIVFDKAEDPIGFAAIVLGRCTMRVDCGLLDPGAVIRPDPGEWYPRMPERLDEEELADWRAGRDAIYQLAALTIGARLAVADG
jgi:hypothetical protein